MTPSLRALTLVLAIAASPAARAERIPDRPKAAGKDRIPDATSVKVTPRSVVPLGGSSLRVYDRKTGTTKTLRSRDRDEITAVGADDTGRRLLVAWKDDTDIHLFDLEKGTHATFPRPNFEGSVARRLAFAKDGKSAFVFDTGGGGGVEVFRQSLDGKGEAKRLFGGEIGDLIWASGSEVITHCQPYLCQSDRIVYRDLETGAETVLFESPDPRSPLSGYRVVPGSVPGDVLLFVNPRRRLVRFRAKEKLLVQIELPQEIANFATNDVPYLVFVPEQDRAWVVTRPGSDLALWSVSIAGKPAEEPAKTIVPSLHAEGDSATVAIYGFAADAAGRLLLHWGDDLFFAGPEGLRATDLTAVLGAKKEWAGLDVLGEAPDELWVGIEVGRSRDFVRVPLAGLAEKAKTVTPGPSGQVPKSDCEHCR